jgi:hypothetical protein
MQYKNDVSPYRLWVIPVTTIVCLWGMAATVYLAVFKGYTRLLSWVITIGLVIAVVGITFAAPRLPARQAFALLATLLLANYLCDELMEVIGFPPLKYLGDLAIGAICTAGFGRHWINKGYIPRWANVW